MVKQTKSAQTALWTYDTAPQSPILAPLGITTRQLKRWTEQRRVPHYKLGHAVRFSDEHLTALVASLTKEAVR